MNVDDVKEIKQSLDTHTIDNVQKQYLAVNELVTRFAASGRLRQLLEIKSSGRYRYPPPLSSSLSSMIRKDM